MDTTAQTYDALANGAALIDETSNSTSVALDATTPVLVPILTEGLGPGVYDLWCEGATLDASKVLIIKWVAVNASAPTAADMTPAAGQVKKFVALPATAARSIKMNSRYQLYAHSIGFTGTLHVARRRSATDRVYGS